MPVLTLPTEEMVQGLPGGLAQRELKRRGINVYDISQIWPVSGWAKSGKLIQGTVEQALFGLTIQERIELFRKCSPVFGIISARMNRISGLEWEITRASKSEDRIVSRLKMLRGLHSEYDEQGDMLHRIIRLRCVGEIRRILKDCRPDLKNFQQALLRWSNRIREKLDDQSRQIKDWLEEPNVHDNYDDFIKKTVQDLMVHGSFSWFKERSKGNLIDNIYVLPGGSVIPLRNRFVGGASGFIQMINAMDPKIYFQEEISYGSYIPSSSLSMGMVPLESLVNKLAEVLLFDQRAAQQADGTVPPEKLVVFGENSPFGDLTTGMTEDLKMPMDKDEQARVETIMNEPRKHAMRVLSGYGSTPQVVDLSRADTFQYQSQRQEKIREEIALVFNMSNVEINLTGSGETSGRATSESQERIEREKGIYPIVKLLENHLNREVLPQRWGTEYNIDYQTGLSDAEQIGLDEKKIRSQTYSVNEIRVARGDEPYEDEQFDKPQGGGQMPPPDGTEQSPFNMSMMEQ